jgi:hypothetical protein
VSVVQVSYQQALPVGTAPPHPMYVATLEMQRPAPPSAHALSEQHMVPKLPHVSRGTVVGAATQVFTPSSPSQHTPPEQSDEVEH